MWQNHPTTALVLRYSRVLVCIHPAPRKTPPPTNSPFRVQSGFQVPSFTKRPRDWSMLTEWVTAAGRMLCPEGEWEDIPDQDKQRAPIYRSPTIHKGELLRKIARNFDDYLRHTWCQWKNIPGKTESRKTEDGKTEDEKTEKKKPKSRKTEKRKTKTPLLWLSSSWPEDATLPPHGMRYVLRGTTTTTAISTTRRLTPPEQIKKTY